MNDRCDHCGSTYCHSQERPPMLVDGDKLHDIRESIADDAQAAGRELARMIAELTIRRIECAVAAENPAPPVRGGIVVNVEGPTSGGVEEAFAAGRAAALRDLRRRGAI